MNSSEQMISDPHSALDYAWVISGAAIVFMMQAGFLCLESGLARNKSSINVALKNVVDFVIAVGCYWLIGFGFMFGASAFGVVGTDYFILDFDANSWTTACFIFQAMFCGTAATIVSGAIAERSRFTAYLMISVTISAFVYPVVGHWCWGSIVGASSSGWLESMGFIDFAGSSVVHGTGAWAAFAAAYMIGPRLDRFDEQGKPREIPASSLQLATLGTLILVFGWFAFNCVSTLTVDASIAGIAAKTILAAVSSAATSMALAFLMRKKACWDPTAIINGALAGLVAITAGCASVTTIGAFLIGIGAGVVVVFGERLLLRLKIDDVVCAVPVHGFSGVWGTIAVAFFIPAATLGELGMSRLGLFGVQVLGAASVAVFVGGSMLVALKVVSLFLPLRVSAEDERLGLNVAEHGASSSLLELANRMHEATRVEQFDESLKVVPEIGTEVGDLAKSFNYLVDAVGDEQRQTRELLNELEKQNESIQRSLSETRRREEVVRATMNEIQRDSESLRSAAKSNSRRASELMHGIRESNEQIVEEFREIVGNVEVLTKLLNDVMEQSRLAIENSREAIGQSEASREALAEMEESTGKIQDVLEQITMLTRDITVLSINASIEATRAGEAGRGFSIVAQQVRTLAGSTNMCKDDITVRVEEVEATSNHICSEIGSTLEQIGSITRGGEKVGESLESVVSEHTRVVGRLQEFIAAAERQSTQLQLRLDESEAASKQFTSNLGDTFDRLNQKLASCFND